MKLNVVGCSPAWPNPRGAQSGYLFEQEGRLLVDCGPGVLPRLRNGVPWPRLDAIAITHFHLDHWGDLVPWAFGALFGPGRLEPPPELWLPPDGADTIRSMQLPLGATAILDVFEVREYEPGQPFEAAGFELTPVQMAHYRMQTFGFRVSAGGKTVAYSGDSGPSPQLALLARDADLFLCEATLGEPEEGLRGHLTTEEALDAFQVSGARRLLVVHRPDELGLPPGVQRAYDGLELEV